MRTSIVPRGVKSNEHWMGRELQVQAEHQQLAEIKEHLLLQWLKAVLVANP